MTNLGTTTALDGHLLPGLDKVSVSLREIVAAFAGSLLVLAAILLYRRYAK